MTMRQLARKAGALALALGALALVLVNAALNHGCGGSRPAESAFQAGSAPPPGSEQARASATPSAAEPPSPHASASASGGVDPDCVSSPYMYATKAPIFVPPKCRLGHQLPPAVQQVPKAPNSAAPQQAR